MTAQEFIEKNIPNATNFQKFLVTWIFDIGELNFNSFNYNNTKDIAIGIYLLCKDLKTDPCVDTYNLIRYFNTEYGYGSLVQNLISKLVDERPDLLELISSISDNSSKYYSNIYMASTDFIKHLETLYNTEKISEEQNKETLIFGDDILNGEMTPRELSDTVRMMNEEYVTQYLSELNIGEITFTISENSIMYLKDTDGIKIASVYTKDGNKQVIRYTNEDGTALFLLFEPKFIKTETIYGLSLDSQNDERGLLILEKDKDDSVYRFLYGRSEF